MEQPKAPKGLFNQNGDINPQTTEQMVKDMRAFILKNYIHQLNW